MPRHLVGWLCVAALCAAGCDSEDGDGDDGSGGQPGGGADGTVMGGGDAAVGPADDGAVGPGRGDAAPGPAGDVATVVPFAGEGPCIGGGGPEYMGTMAVTIDGAPIGPFSVWGIGAAATNFSLHACGPPAGCARGQCWPEFAIDVVHRNVAVGDALEGDRVIAADATQTMTINYFHDDITERSASGTATVTTFDFDTLHFVGEASVTTVEGTAVTVRWDVDGPE